MVSLGIACGVQCVVIYGDLSGAGAVHVVLCLCGLTVPDVCHPTRDLNCAHLRPSIVLSPLAGQIAGHLVCGAGLLGYQGAS